ncbi:MAG: site-specific integrase [Ruminococcaceae bacterium]|jgi:integrase|nr:site-specific integrase [Oscillospiraceae bacterium]
MASIVSRSNGTYLIRISMGVDSNGKQISRSKSFKPSKPNLPYTKLNREIEAFILAFEKELESENVPRPIRPDQITFKDFCVQYLEIKKPSLSPNTYNFYSKVIEEELIPMFARLKMCELRTYHIQQFVSYLATEKKRLDGREGKIAASTVKRYTTVLRSIVTTAYKLEYIEDDIGRSRRIEFPKEETKEVEAFTIQEVGDILNALESEPINIRALIEVALFTGCRRGEIVGLKWADIDFEKQRISIKRSIYKLSDGKAREKEPKSRCSIRTISIPDRLCKTLTEYRIHQNRHIAYLGDTWKNNDYVFTEENGYVMNPHTPTKQFSKFLKRHGIRHLKFHGLRHTSATMLLANGCDIKTVSSRLGHADITTTNIYVHALESTDRLAAETFDNFLKKNKM